MPPNPDSSAADRLLAAETFLDAVFGGFDFEAEACDFTLLLFEDIAELLADATWAELACECIASWTDWKLSSISATFAPEVFALVYPFLVFAGAVGIF